MRMLVFCTAVIAGFGCAGTAPSNAAPWMSGIGKTNATIQNIGYWRRYHRRYGYPAPFAYYPPAYGYYVPPAAYAYPPAIGYAPPLGGGYADGPGAAADYNNAPPSEDEYTDEGNYGDTVAPEDEYPAAPPPQSY